MSITADVLSRIKRYESIIYRLQSAGDTDKWLMSSLLPTESGLRAYFPQYGQMPQHARAALIDMAFSLGLRRLLAEYPLLMAAIRRMDWAAAATLCKRTGIPEMRNTEIRQLFEEAAKRCNNPRRDATSTGEGLMPVNMADNGSARLIGVLGIAAVVGLTALTATVGVVGIVGAAQRR